MIGNEDKKEEEKLYQILITLNKSDIHGIGINVHVEGWDGFQAQIVLSNAIEAVRKEIMQKSNIIVPGRKGRIQ